MSLRVAVLSDTHSPRHWKRCADAVARQLYGVDVILHAGDVCLAATLDDLARFAPVHAVLGNNDGPDVAAWGASERLSIELDGLAVGMVHDSGPRTGRAARLRRMFPSESLVVFGHSHIPWDETVGGQRALNPGSPTDKRRQPHGTIASLVIDSGELVSARLVEVS